MSANDPKRTFEQAERATRRSLPPQEAQLVAGPDAVPTPAGWGVDALRLPAVGPVVIIAIVVKERAHHPEPVVVVMAKVVMGKALPVEFATYAATTSLAHMAFGKTSTDATAAPKSPAATTTTPPATAAVSKRIASDACACQCQRGNESRNLMQTKRLHRRLPFRSFVGNRA